jgi:TetR/AcrR family transcriptional repressor of lmrAB and yxaGH operons
MPAALDAQQKSEIVDQLFLVFRDRGYEGASLADLSEATGLGKSSLYHHFPGGKEQMAEAVLERAKAFIQSAIADVAQSREPLTIRIRKVATAFDQIYAGGHMLSRSLPVIAGCPQRARANSPKTGSRECRDRS